MPSADLPQWNLRVRGLRARDLDDLASILDCPGALGGTLQIPFRDHHFFARRYGEAADGVHRLVAVIDEGTSPDGERAIGTLSLHATMGPRRSHVGGLGMWVHDDYAGRGVGTALMSAACDLADRWLGAR